MALKHYDKVHNQYFYGQLREQPLQQAVASVER